MKLVLPEGEGGGRTVLDLSLAKGTDVGERVARGGVAGYEPETLATALALVENYGIAQFIDIGANIGFYALVMKALCGDRLAVDAYEPMPELNAIASGLAAANGLSINLRAEALSNVSGVATFYLSAKSDTSNSLNARFRPAKGTIEVTTATLDSIYAEAPRIARLIKVDTESTEPDVLAGGRAFIATHRPWIICEVLANRTEARLASFLEEVGYGLYRLTRAGPEPATVLQGDPTYEVRDWLFAPEPLAARVLPEMRKALRMIETA